MKKWVSIFLALAIIAVFAVGCGVSKEAKVKCPACGAIFTVQEGVGAVDWNWRSPGT